MFKKLYRKFTSSLTVRIFAITFVLLSLTSIIVYHFLLFATPISYDSFAGERLRNTSTELVELLQSSKKSDAQDVIDAFTKKINLPIQIHRLDGSIYLENSVPIESDDPLDVYVTVGTASGNLVEDLPDNVYISTQMTSLWTSAAVSTSTDFQFKDDDEKFVLFLYAGVATRNHTIEAMQSVFPYLAVVIVLISVIFSVFYSKYITRPVVKLSEISKKMTELDFTWHTNEKRRDELGDLGRNLDILSNKLSVSLDELKTANQKLKDDMEKEHMFFSAASHELKTPLTVIKGQLTGMIDGVGVYKDRDKYLNRSLMAASRMEKLINEILLVSKSDEGIKLDKSRFCLSGLFLDVIGDCAEIMAMRGQEIDVQISPDITVNADERLLQKAISNLLTNAIIHSPENEKITATLTPEKLTITNSGINITKDDLAHIFEPFYRADKSRNRDTGGSGMGLYITDRILRAHGADLTIQNVGDSVQAVVDISGIS